MLTEADEGVSSSSGAVATQVVAAYAFTRLCVALGSHLLERDMGNSDPETVRAVEQVNRAFDRVRAEPL